MVNPIPSDYILGYSHAEQDRLIRQATLLAPITERLFREAGIGPGCHVLDIGSGMGDVAMIAARLVGSSGEVLGIEQNASFVARARERVAAVGFRNVSFIQADANAMAVERPFGAVVGRLVLNHNPDPVTMLKSAKKLLTPGGICAFQEIAVSPALAVAAGLPLWAQVVTRIHEMIHKSGMKPDAGLALHRIFQEVGFCRPHIHLDVPFTQDASIAQLQVDLLRTLAGYHAASLSDLGDLETLVERIHSEAESARAASGFMAIVSAWSRKIG